MFSGLYSWHSFFKKPLDMLHYLVTKVQGSIHVCAVLWYPRIAVPMGLKRGPIPPFLSGQLCIVQEGGEFRKAAPEEIAKRRIVKARRGGAAPASEAGNTSADEPAKPAAAAFSWAAAATTKGVSPEACELIDRLGSSSCLWLIFVLGQSPMFVAKLLLLSERKGLTGVRVHANLDTDEDKEAGNGESAKADGKGKAGEGEAGKAQESKETAEDGSAAPAEKKPLFTFSAFGTGSSFGSSTAPAFSFASAAASGAAAAKPFAFGMGLSNGFSFGTGGMASFSSVGTQGWNTSAEKKDDDEDGKDGEGGEEDAESEVAVKKGDGVVQLEEVETCTGEENERCVFQVRAKLFTFGKPHAADGEGEEKEAAVADAPKVPGGGGKDSVGVWNVTGIGNLRINVPKDESSGARPRIVMRRQKTFQVCLNTYLFESMLCDKAGPKDVRFTVRPHTDPYIYIYIYI
jgi:hypothetical protein